MDGPQILGAVGAAIAVVYLVADFTAIRQWWNDKL